MLGAATPVKAAVPRPKPRVPLAVPPPAVTLASRPSVLDRSKVTSANITPISTCGGSTSSCSSSWRTRSECLGEADTRTVLVFSSPLMVISRSNSLVAEPNCSSDKVPTNLRCSSSTKSVTIVATSVALAFRN